MTMKTTAVSHQHSKALLWLMTMGVFLLLAFHVSPFWGLSTLLWFKGLMAGLAFVAFINASILTGYRHASVFLALGAVIGWSFEHLGVITGAVFGPYVYTEKLGFKIGAIPWVIPLCWFGIVYFAHVITNLILQGKAAFQTKTMPQAAIMAILTALIATSMDMALDPTMSHPDVKAWIWTDGGQYFGVPFKNFAGWILTAFLIDFFYRLYAKRNNAKSMTSKKRLSASYAVIAWAGLGFGFMVIGFPVETQLVAIFCVLLPAFFASARLLTSD